MSPRAWRGLSAAVVALLAVTELVVRSVGLVDFPIYQVDDHVGYFPQPSQSGAFLGRNRWVFNSSSMGIEAPWKPSDRADILLIGNSIILGGNPYDQAEKVAPQMQRQVGSQCAVWPVATGGWGTVNEYRFLERHPDIVEGADFFIWEIMAHQMAGPQGWTRETAIPTRHPWWATGYVVRKLMHDHIPKWTLPEPQRRSVSEAELASYYQGFELMLDRLSRTAERRPAGIVFLYPDRQQLQGARSGLEWFIDRDRVEQIAKVRGLLLIDITRYPQWTDGMYRDHVHPTAEGNAVLADILRQALRQVMPAC